MNATRSFGIVFLCRYNHFVLSYCKSLTGGGGWGVSFPGKKTLRRFTVQLGGDGWGSNFQEKAYITLEWPHTAN